MTTMHIDMKFGESFTIGGTVIEAVKKDGQRVRLKVRAPADTKVTPPKAMRERGPTGTHECAPESKELHHG